MSRIRTIKPQFFLHDGLFDAERDSGLPLRLAFISLWTIADREGRFKWRPRAIKAQCLPYDDIDFSRVLDALVTRGFVVKYACDGDVFGVIPSFLQHQVVNCREMKSDLPEPNENNIIDACPTRDDACPTRDDACTNSVSKALVEGKGREQEQEGKDSSLRSESNASSLRSDASRKKTPKAKPKPLEILKTALSEKTAQDVIDHRKAKRAPLTPRAAQGLVAAFRDHGDCEAAAEAMITNGWQGFKSEWMRTPPARAGPSGYDPLNGKAEKHDFVWLSWDRNPEQWNAWENIYRQSHNGMSHPRDKKGGWYFPSEYPPTSET